MLLRLGAFGAIGGAALWIIGFVGASIGVGFAPGWLGLITLGTIGLLMALVGLSAFQAHREPRLAWAAFAIPATGTLISLVGIFGMFIMPDSDTAYLGSFTPWEVWAIGALGTLVGCVLFGAATLRASVLSRWAAGGLAGSSAAILLLATGLFGRTGTGGPGTVYFLGALLTFGASWGLLGISALRRGPIRAIAAA